MFTFQSKATEVVRSSDDDAWYLDEDGGITVQDRFSIEIQSRGSDPLFAEEYEIESDSGTDVEEQSNASGSELVSI